MVHDKCGLEFREGAKGSCLNCRHCNKYLGGFKDSREILLNAAKYLEDTCRYTRKA